MLCLLSRCAFASALRLGVRIVLLILLVTTAGSVGDNAVAGSGSRNLLVLKNGRVVSGRISQSAGGYLVQMETGSVLVPFDRVRLRATDLHDAYRRFLSTFPNPSPQTHVALARWCLTQQLYDETKIELRSALRINPNHSEARDMLRRLEEILNPQNARHRAVATERLKTDDGFESPPSRSLAGLSHGAARDFVTRVQPLMMNNCALAGCHSTGSRNAFQLARVRIGSRSSRVLTERNLAATLQQINRSDADRSPLLTAPRGNHGRGGRPVFAGPHGSDHVLLLRNWVRRIATESASASEVNAPGRRARDRSADSHAARRGVSLPPNADSRPRTVNGSKLQPERMEDVAGGDSLLEAILNEKRRDAFDPAEFNRQQTTAAPR